MRQGNNDIEESQDRKFDIISLATLAVLILTLALAIFGGQLVTINWGINQAEFLPAYLFYIWIILTVVVIAWLLIRRRSQPGMEKFVNSFWEDHILRSRLIFILGVLIIFVIFRYQAHLYGNGYIRISNFAQRTKPIFRWFEYGGTIIPYLFYKIMALTGIAKVSAASWGYSIVSFLSGVLFLLINFKIAEIVTPDNRNRALVVGLAIFSGMSFYFFGLVEVYPISIALGALFVYFLIKSMAGHKVSSLYFLWGTVIIGAVINVEFLTTVPAAIYVTILQFQRDRNRFSLAGWITAIIMILVGIVTLYIMAARDFGVANTILFIRGKSPEGDYGLFGSHHLLDLFNLFSLIAPLFLIFALYAVLSIKRIMKDNISLTLRILAASQFVGLFVLDPKNGMIRDYVSFGFFMTGFIYLGIYSIVTYPPVSDRFGRIKGILAPASVLLLLPALIVHLAPEKSAQSIDRFLTYNETKLESAYLAMRDYYYVDKNFPEADRRDQSVVSKAKGALQSRLVEDLYSHDRIDESFSYANLLVEMNPYNATYRMQKANLLKYFKRYGEAKAQLDTALTLEPYRTELYHYRAALFRELGNTTGQYEDLKKGLEIDPSSTLLLSDLAGYYFTAKAYNRTDSLAELVIELDTTQAYACVVSSSITNSARLSVLSYALAVK